MNKTKTDLERSVMDGLEEIDVDLMMKIQDQMFTFDNLATVDNKGIQVLMRNVEPEQLMVALKGAPEEVLARFMDNMSERARGMFKDDMDARGPVRVADVEDAQKKIMRLARKLSDSGELILGGADFV
jgi:flagellar motor switch protein FliG